MQPEECLHALGLRETATPAQIKSAYRRLALRWHPDLHAGDEQSRQAFERVMQAYRTLMTACRAAQAHRPVGHCAICGEFGEVGRGLDGRLRCRRCVLQPEGGRLLPMPALVVVKGVLAMALLAGGLAMLVLALLADDASSARRLAVAAGLGAMLSLSWLAWISLRVVHCIQPRERALLRSNAVAAEQVRRVRDRAGRMTGPAGSVRGRAG